MSDLVTRLREGAEMDPTQLALLNVQLALRQAADEIEKQRADVLKWYKGFHIIAAERDRYKRVLDHWVQSFDGPEGHGLTQRQFNALVRAALSNTADLRSGSLS